VFAGFREQKKENQSEPASPEKSKSDVAINRSNSLPTEAAENGNLFFQPALLKCLVMYLFWA